MRLGVSNFLNAKPYFTVHHTLSAPPKALRDALLQKELDAALISAEAYLDYKNIFRNIPYGIGSEGATGSVFLYLKKPEKAHWNLAVTTASQTAVTLLKILCTHFWKKSFTIFSSATPAAEACDGYLLIGDEALFCKEGRTYDLGSAWQEFTGLPFIFALFAIHKDIPYQTLEKELAHSLDHFFQNVHKEPFKDYFMGLDYQLGPKHFKALDLFHELRQKLP